ncbi:MAG TPA: hypothetical protein VGZ47_08100 [Gemmataceae bacterium]|nr:hypothetical protein [Gemmataceae bacterium]
MSIPVKCSCGRTLLLKPEFAGKRVKCPLCKASLLVPNEEPQEEIVSDIEIVKKEDDFESDFEIVDDTKAPAKPSSATAIVATRPGLMSPDHSEEPRQRMPRPPRPRRRSRSRYYDDYPEPERYRGGGLAISQGVIAGVIMMVLAVVWLVVGLMVGWLFWYPPILFVLGIVRIVRSIVSGDDDENWWW